MANKERFLFLKGALAHIGQFIETLLSAGTIELTANDPVVKNTSYAVGNTVTRVDGTFFDYKTEQIILAGGQEQYVVSIVFNGDIA